MKVFPYKEYYDCVNQLEVQEKGNVSIAVHQDRLEPLFGVQFDDGSPYINGTISDMQTSLGCEFGDDTLLDDPEYELSFPITSSIPATATIQSIYISFDLENTSLTTDVDFAYGLFDKSDGIDLDSGFPPSPTPAYTVVTGIGIGATTSQSFTCSNVSTVSQSDFITGDIMFTLGWNGNSKFIIKNLIITITYLTDEKHIRSEYVHLDPCNIKELSNALDFCKDVPFASHIKYYPQSGFIAPAGYTPFDFCQTFNSAIGTTNATDSYIHAIYGIVSSTPVIDLNADDATSPFDSSLHGGILATDTVTIQNAIDVAVVAMGFSIGEAIYTITTSNEIALWCSPALSSAIAGGTYIQLYIGPSSVNGNYTNKVDITCSLSITNNDILIPLSSNTTCIPVQEIKYKNTCTGVETYKYVVENGFGLLVLASTVITGFDEEQIKESCPVFEKAGMIQFVGTTTISIPASGVISFTVTANNGSWDISFDGGTTWITGRKGSRTWGNTNITELADTALIQIRGNSISSDIDVIYETIV